MNGELIQLGTPTVKPSPPPMLGYRRMVVESLKTFHEPVTWIDVVMKAEPNGIREAYSCMYKELRYLVSEGWVDEIIVNVTYQIKKSLFRLSSRFWAATEGGY